MIEAVVDEISRLPAHGVVSASVTWADPMQNMRRHAELGAELGAYGFEPTSGIGRWRGVPDLHWVVPGIPVPLLVKMGRKFCQEAVLHVCANGTEVLVRLT